MPGFTRLGQFEVLFQAAEPARFGDGLLYCGVGTQYPFDQVVIVELRVLFLQETGKVRRQFKCPMRAPRLSEPLCGSVIANRSIIIPMRVALMRSSRSFTILPSNL